MNNTDKVYLIKWVGPFSYDELYNWEKKWLENNNENFNLYLLQGKRKYARKFSYYCGQTIRCVYRRLKDKDHHFKEIEHSDYSIWIGKFSNVVPNKTDINVVEKIITSELAVLELGFENMMNEINFHPPVFDVYIINQWYHPIKNNEWKRIHYNSPANYIPDLMIYDWNKFHVIFRFSLILHPDSVCDILRSIVEISRSRRVWAKTFLIKVAV